MSYDGLDGLRVHLDAGIAWVTIDNGPINLLDGPLIFSLARLCQQIEADADVRVVVFRSANPDFFIAHADVGLILGLPTEPKPKPTELSFFHAMVEGWRNLPKATIAQLEGCTRGGGSELALSLDMRFAAIGRAVLSQPEVALGILPGGSGCQRLPRLMGRGRALEVVLGCDDFDAELAERYGWINRALPAEEIGAFVERLARRIASFPAEAIALAKQSVAAAESSPVPGLLEESWCFDRSVATPEARARMTAFLEEHGGQTPEVERELQTLLDRLTRTG
jgi:enoyl-CoA hydratase/carnithine racemase